MKSSSNAATHLPLLPSARREKLVVQRRLAKNDEKSLDKQKGELGQKEDDGAVIVDKSVSGVEKNKVSPSNQENQLKQQISSDHPFVPSSTLSSAENKKTSYHEENVETCPSTSELKKPSDITQHEEKEISRLKSMKKEQIQKLSSMHPLSASTTTNSVMHFIHTTVKYMNDLSVEVDDKLTRFEDSIENLELKLNLVENKLESTKYVKLNNIMK